MTHALRFFSPSGRNRILRLAVTNWILGAALGITCAALLLWLDVAGLRDLMWRPDRVVWEGLALLFGGFAATFGGGVCAAAVMMVPAADDDRPSGLRSDLFAEPEAAAYLRAPAVREPRL